MAKDFFEDNEDDVEEEIIPTRVEEEKEEVVDFRPQMATAKVFERMLSESAKLQNKQNELDTNKLAKQAEFLDYANKNGFSPKDICQLYNDAITMAKDKKDSRAMVRLAELVSKTMFEPANDMSKFFLSVQQNNIKMMQKNGSDKDLEDATNALNSLPDHIVKKFLADKLQEMMKNG